MNLIARREEIKELERITSSKRSEFVVVYGRRRVGKTYLIDEFFDRKYSFLQQAFLVNQKRINLLHFLVP